MHDGCCLPATGVLLWSIYTGKPPYGKLTRAQIMIEIVVQKRELQLPPNAPADYKVGRPCHSQPFQLHQC